MITSKMKTAVRIQVKGWVRKFFVFIFCSSDESLEDVIFSSDLISPSFEGELARGTL